MHKALVLTALFSALSVAAATASADRDSRYFNGKYEDYYEGHGYYDNSGRKKQDESVQLGPRPFYLIEGMDEGKLKSRLLQCKDGPFYRSDFSIGHRGAALQFPEHTKESYEAGARMGAGIVECDVTFTVDGDLVCRHAECDLHTTTNILVTGLASKCEVNWSGPNQTPAPKCCTSALTLAEFKSLQGKMDSSNPAAATVEGYLGGNPTWRTELYTGRGTLVTLDESIKLNQKNGVKHTPELKEGDPQRIATTFGGQDKYAQKLVDTLVENGVNPRDAWPQSFNVNDILYWVKNTGYGKQAAFLIDYDAVNDDIILRDEAGQPVPPADRPAFFKRLKRTGVEIIAPAMPALLAVTSDGQIVPSKFAQDLKAWGFDIITWTFERADLRKGASKAGFYYDFDPTGKAIKKDSDMYKALDVLARKVGILGIFSDWPATVTYYANCMGLK